MNQTDIYIFNPDHDLALANFDVNYMPPAAAQQFAIDFACFPAWYADAGCSVLASSAYNDRFLDEVGRLFHTTPSLITEVELKDCSHAQFRPWGWNPALCKRLLNAGVSSSVLPDVEQLKIIRHLSNRLQAVNLLPHLIYNGCVGESYYYTDADEVQRFVTQHSSSLLKAPLSGSGKGLNWCKGAWTPAIHQWVKNVLRQQGGVVAEPIYKKVIDFSMQFFSGGKNAVIFCGYSFFSTNNGGAYQGNYLATDAQIEADFLQYISRDLLVNVRTQLEQRLGELLAGHYRGYLGVDMMICEVGNADFRLHPCVEINLRMNMGMASRTIYDRYVLSEKRGEFRVAYYPFHEQLVEHHGLLTQQHPLVVENNRVVSGYLPLVPLTPSSRYLGWILVG